jgi:signal transduction histidine kinase
MEGRGAISAAVNDQATACPSGSPDPRHATTAPRSLAAPAPALSGGRHLALAAAARVGVNLALTAAYAWGALAGAGPWYATGVVLRAVLLLCAVAVLAGVRLRVGPTRLAPAAGAAIDAASLLVGISRIAAGSGQASAGAAVGAALELAALTALGGVTLVQLALPLRREPEAAPLLDVVRGTLEELTARLERSNQALLEARERGEALAQLVVHDLRNPLATVLANVMLVRDTLARIPELADEAECLRVAADEAVRLSGMIGDLLLVPRLERGDLVGHFSSVRVREVIEAAARTASAQGRAKEIGIEIVAPQDLVAWLDPALVRRMLENLAANGLRHTPRGGRIELAARVERDRLRLAVRNTGERVPATVRAHLFEKHASSDPADLQRSGLGLYLCRLVAEAHGGHIGLVEREGWNVSFEAELPLAGQGARPATRVP